MSYSVHNLEYKEMMVNWKKNNKATNDLYIDNSAFSIKRNHNESYDKCPYTDSSLGSVAANYCQVGKNMYPMVNGFLWH